MQRRTKAAVANESRGWRLWSCMSYVSAERAPQEDWPSRQQAAGVAPRPGAVLTDSAKLLVGAKSPDRYPRHPSGAWCTSDAPLGLTTR